MKNFRRIYKRTTAKEFSTLLRASYKMLHSNPKYPAADGDAVPDSKKDVKDDDDDDPIEI